MSETLPPCPFCGGRGEEDHDRISIECQQCGAEVFGDTIEKARENWSRRTPGPTTAKLLAKIAWFLERFAGVDDLEVPIKREMAAAAIAEHGPARPAGEAP